MRLAVSDLRAGYGSATIIDGISLEAGDGQAIALVGRNGMGKTTLVRAILGYLPGSQGRVQVGGRDMLGWPTHKIIRAGVGYGPQDENVFADLTVADNLSIGWGRGAADPRRRRAVLEHFPVLGTRLRQHAGTLSGGEQKMLVLARALLQRPGLLILDEISDGLQPAMVTRVEEVLREERRRGDLTVLMVEQNLDLSLRIADRVAVMKLGRLVFEAPCGQPGVRAELARQLAP